MNIKLFETNSDVTIRTLSDKIRLLEYENGTLNTHIKTLEQDLYFYKNIYHNLEDYNQFIQFRNKLDELLDTNTMDIEDMQYEWKEAYKKCDLEKMDILFNKMIKYQSPELLAEIEALKDEIQDLETEIESLEQEE